MRNWFYGIMGLLLLTWVVSYGYIERTNREVMANALEADYQREFYNLVSHVEQTRVLLGKSLASGSPRHNILYLTEIWNRASDASVSLAQLPLTDINTSASRKFLTQLGDYAYSLAHAEANGRELTEQDYQNLEDFYDELGKFSEDLHEMASRVYDDNYRFTDSMLRRGMRTAIAANDHLSNFVDIERRLQGLPSLIYDGPFSDHLELIEPRGLTGSQISQASAESKAKEFLEKSRKQGYVEVGSADQVNGKIKAYSFTFDPQNSGGLITIDISKKGGHPITMLNSRPVENVVLSQEEASRKGKEFLESLGYKNMVETYTVRQQNSQVISYAYQQDEVIIYPDLIKLKIALDNGEIIGFESFGYLMAHHERELPEPELTPEEAKAKVNSRVQVEGIRKAVIPMLNGKEAFTYEINGKLNGEQYLIYINALTGDEENILQVVSQPEGKLAI
ncbi:MAG: germination protein YpeB [Zhaonellaceae bacterium]|jgi:spore germination protein|nr:germination protein YpeB [Clostridia bacterium]